MLVPVMAALYITIGAVVILFNIDRLPEVVSVILKDAFNFKAILGGISGSCVIMGIKRGLFSNEAGMGSAPNAAAAASVSHPAKQGLVQVLSVFIDTMIICSTTGFLILFAGQYTVHGELNGIPLVQQSIGSVFGPMGIHFTTIAVVLFAFTSLIGNYFYAEFNVRFISENSVVLFLFRASCVVMVFIGAINSMDAAWALADITMGFMALVNLYAIIRLRKVAGKVLNDFETQLKAGKNPVFHAKEAGVENTYPGVWD